MVEAKKERIRDVLRDIDVVEKPPTSLTPEARKILDAIYDTEKSGKKPELRVIEMKILNDAKEEISKQPIVEPESRVTNFGNSLIKVEEVVGRTSTKIRPSLVENELKSQLAQLLKAGYVVVQFEEREKKLVEIYRLTPEGVDQIEKFRKIPGLV
jgi:predicted transcriptional regulator